AQEAAEKDADLALRTAAAQSAEAEVRRVEETLSFTKVTAPFDGVITERRADVGQLITAASGHELFHLAEIRRLRVFVRVPQTLARAIRAGEQADLTLNELPGRVFPATVVRTAGAMDAQSRTLLTELEVDNSRGEILAGSFAQVRFRDAVEAIPLPVPANALIFRAEGPQLAVVGSNAVVEIRRVTLGRDFGSSLEILEGLGANERVVLNPVDSLASGQ